MKIILYKAFLLCILMLTAGCSGFIKGDGKLVRNNLIVKDFNELNIACTSGEIHYIQSEGASGLSITTDRNVLDMLDIKQDGRQIIIKLKKEFEGKFIMPTQFTVTANSQTLKELNLAGKCTFNVDSPFRSEELEINVAGSGTINLKDSVIVDRLTTSIAGSSTVNANMLDVSHITASIAGSGTYHLKGEAGSVAFQVAGKGTVEALDLEASDISCEVAGYGKMDLYATESINLQIAGIGRIKYKGNPKITQEGFAFVRKAD